MSLAGDLAKENIEFCETLAQIYEGKGYSVDCSLFPELNGYCSGTFYIYDPENRDDTRQAPQVYRALRRHESDDEDVQSNRQRLLREAADFPSLIDFRRGNILRHIESLREMAQAADLPDDFLNPVMEWVERLKTTMLPAPSAQHPAPSPSDEEVDDLLFP